MLCRHKLKTIKNVPNFEAYCFNHPGGVFQVKKKKIINSDVYLHFVMIHAVIIINQLKNAHNLLFLPISFILPK